jgi:hypothetical protein
MVTLVGLGRVLLLLVLAVLVVSLVMGVGSGDTGVLEKVVLGVLIVGCIALAAKISSVADTLRIRLQKH